MKHYYEILYRYEGIDYAGEWEEIPTHSRTLDMAMKKAERLIEKKNDVVEVQINLFIDDYLEDSWWYDFNAKKWMY